MGYQRPGPEMKIGFRKKTKAEAHRLLYKGYKQGVKFASDSFLG